MADPAKDILTDVESKKYVAAWRKAQELDTNMDWSNNTHLRNAHRLLQSADLTYAVSELIDILEKLGNDSNKGKERATHNMTSHVRDKRSRRGFVDGSCMGTANVLPASSAMTLSNHSILDEESTLTFFTYGSMDI